MAPTFRVKKAKKKNNLFFQESKCEFLSRKGLKRKKTNSRSQEWKSKHDLGQSREMAAYMVDRRN
jgi:hypothetical protein